MILSNPSLINGTADMLYTINYLNDVTTSITRYVGTSLYIFGLLGALLNMYVLSQSSLRSNSCCLFLLALNIVDLLHIHNSLLIRIAQHGFHWDPTVFFPLFCRIRYYIGYVLITLYLVLIILMSCERYGSTRKRFSSWRQFSQPATARYTILICTLICCFVCLFVLSCYGVNETSICLVRKGLCTMFTTVYTFVIIGFVPPVCTATFAWLTLRHLHTLRRRSRAGPSSYKTYLRIKQANEQLTWMFLMQIVIMLVSSLPYASLMIYQLNTRHMNKRPLRIAWEQLIAHSIHLLTYVNYVCSAYIYLITSPMYRQHLMFRGKEFRLQKFGFGIEVASSVLSSLDRPRKTMSIPSAQVDTSDIIEEQQQRSRVVSFSLIRSQPDSFDGDRFMTTVL